MDITLVFETNVARSNRAESTYGLVVKSGSQIACTDQSPDRSRPGPPMERRTVGALIRLENDDDP